MASILIGLIVMIVWALVSRRLADARVTGPSLMVIAGIAIGFTTSDEIGHTLNTVVAERVVELILALLLFVDAMEVKGGYFGGERGSTLRLLLIGIPLSLVLAVGFGALLLPGLSFAVLLIIACVIVPTDFTPAPAILRDRRLPRRIRHLLNVESGYNDGVIAPVFIFALALAEDNGHDSALEALGDALPAAGLAVLVGTPIGIAAAWLTSRSIERDLASASAIRMSLVLVPLLSYATATWIDANGFVAAFICGLAYRATRSPSEVELSLAEDLSTLTSLAMWFVFGLTTVLLASFGVDWRVIVFAIAGLTIVRMLPVYLSLLRSDLTARDRLLVGALGPRGTASIVFGLLAYNALDGVAADDVLYAMAATVIGSVLLHGVGAAWLSDRLGRRASVVDDSSAGTAG
ncbi:cation:proton antiporter [Gordonia sp. ABSL11-1]|uniref:cation:proton antiporter n=1 Tax=Gordonia sp. ABSL11-1 TaxID=3053924 RepID=UPI00257357A3|nr:cation:proton antiporter [Gordonia sp. ABSL11-1]MDL9946879.1 cation:proton antiporter [Gordonia sp. ABSL11-1]